MARHSDKSQVQVFLSLAELEQILGGPQKAKLKIKNTIVQEFANRHLKALVNTEAVKEIGRVIEQGVTAEVAKQVGTIDWARKVTLNPTLREYIRAEITRHINDVLGERIKECVETAFEDVEGMVTRAAERVIVQKVNKIIEIRIDALKKEVTKL